jgi:hypothetical protein
MFALSETPALLRLANGADGEKTLANPENHAIL